MRYARQDPNNVCDNKLCYINISMLKGPSYRQSKGNVTFLFSSSYYYYYITFNKDFMSFFFFIRLFLENKYINVRILLKGKKKS